MFYVYLHTRNDTGEIFYVGKGKGKRAFQTVQRSDSWKELSSKHGHSVHLIHHDLNEQEAFAIEAQLIMELRDVGHPLVNKTSGGQGLSGHKHSEETKQQIRTTLIGRVFSTESLAKMGQAKRGKETWMKGKKHRPESLQKISQNSARKGKPGTRLGVEVSIKTRLLISNRNLGNTHALGHQVSPESRKAMGIKNIGNSHASGKRSEESRAKMALAYWTRINQGTKHVPQFQTASRIGEATI